MPPWQVMSERANLMMSRDNILELAKDVQERERVILDPNTTLSSAARMVGIAQSDDEENYLSRWPAGIQRALIAALHSAVTRQPPLPVTISWAPGYDFEIQIWEAAGTPTSRGGMTILLRSRYPDEMREAPVESS